MSACQEIEDMGNVQDELTRIRDLMKLIYAIAGSKDRTLSDISNGLQWVVGDIEADIDRIIAGIQKIEEART
jgi:hypothetical protein